MLKGKLDLTEKMLLTFAISSESHGQHQWGDLQRMHTFMKVLIDLQLPANHERRKRHVSEQEICNTCIYLYEGVDIRAVSCFPVSQRSFSFSMGSNVLPVPQAELFDCPLHYIIPSITSHGFGAANHLTENG